MEAGLALIASCLPTLNVLANQRALQSAIDSVRSAISLQSIRLRGSPASHSSGRRGSSGTVQGQYNKLDGPGAYPLLLRRDAMAEITNDVQSEIKEPSLTLSPGTIRVQREFETATDLV